MRVIVTPAHPEVWSDDQIMRDALANYRRWSIPHGTSELHVHSTDMAEYVRRADRAEALLADLLGGSGA